MVSDLLSLVGKKALRKMLAGYYRKQLNRTIVSVLWFSVNCLAAVKLKNCRQPSSNKLSSATVIVLLSRFAETTRNVKFSISRVKL